MSRMNEALVEQATLDWLNMAGYRVLHGPDIAPNERAAERNDYREVLLLGRLRKALTAINDHLPARVRSQAVDDAIRQVQTIVTQDPIHSNHAFHRLLVEGVDVAYAWQDGTRHEKVWLLDYANPQHNDWLAVNQFTVTGINPRTQARTERRPDVVLFVNGLPLVVIELKNISDRNATLDHAHNQLQTYREDISALLAYSGLLAISDGVFAELGTLTAGREWFKPWRELDEQKHDRYPTQLEALIRGVFAPERLLDILRYFVVFTQDGPTWQKKVAGYHQYHAVNRALDHTLKAVAEADNQRVGVIWHTQGSGKSLTMLFYAGKVIQQPAMTNPTLVILTDRNDLDNQLFDTFSAGQEVLRQRPTQAESREHLKQLLQVASGGVVFTTIQKFRPDGDTSTYPQLSARQNIIFIADEAHRSQYGFDAHLIQRGDSASMTYGFAKYLRDALPNASFIGFTGTPIEAKDANTREVFGEYIDVYDIQQAVSDGSTVPIYYEARYVNLTLREEQRPKLDSDFEEITEGEEIETKERLKTKWSQLEAIVGAEPRLRQVANDIITHFEQRLEVIDGKGMIVCMSRRIAVDLYTELIRQRPNWHADTDESGWLKVVMTGSADDPLPFQPHIRNKERRKALAERFKEANNDFRLVIVRDMWLTGFDAPSLHTMYLDKPMRGHTLMQAIARVNRVFKDKPGGLVVDYLGIGADLQEAVHTYTAAKSASPIIYFEKAVSLLKDKYGIVRGFFHGLGPSFTTGEPTQLLSRIPLAMEHILSQPDGKKQYLQAVTELSQAFSLVHSSQEAAKIRDEVAFFQAVQAAFTKNTVPITHRPAVMESAVKQIISQAVTAEGVVDILGLSRPNLAILSDEFLAGVQRLEHKNLALEVLQKLLNDEISLRLRKNIVQARAFSKRLEDALMRYHNRAVDSASVIGELITLARELREAQLRGEVLGLSEDEVAFYDALADNDSAVQVMGDDKLSLIASELVKSVRDSLSVDWSFKQAARAKLRVLVKRILRQYGYPPDLQESATDLVIEQTELLAQEWVLEHKT